MRQLSSAMLPNLLFKSGWLTVGFLLLVSGVHAQQNQEEVLLKDEDYRMQIEEVIVVGQQPEWRQNKKPEEWRPDQFKLLEQSSDKGVRWLPEYTKDERDNYDGVRDRTGEKPEIKLFEWKF